MSDLKIYEREFKCGTGSHITATTTREDSTSSFENLGTSDRDKEIVTGPSVAASEDSTPIVDNLGISDSDNEIVTGPSVADTITSEDSTPIVDNLGTSDIDTEIVTGPAVADTITSEDSTPIVDNLGSAAEDTPNLGVVNVKKQDIKSLQEAVWLTRAGISKGRFHDRQDLGFILKENTILRIRQINPMFTNKLILRLLSNDSREELEIKVGSEWVQIKSPVCLVPFIDTPYDNQEAKIEYRVDGNIQQKPLAIYEKDNDKVHFFNVWNEYDGEFALIKGKQFQLFIPKRDKELVRNLKDFSSLDELIDYYEELFNYYDKMIGLDNSAPENNKSENRYFLKADANDINYAYYNDNWTARSTLTIELWLVKNSWGTLHEIAHGYEAAFTNQGIDTDEVFNNLFCVQYQYDKSGKKADETGWLFNYGEKAKLENEMYEELIKNKKGYESVGVRKRLILLTMLKQKAGDGAFTKMNQDYRKIASQKEFNIEDYPLPDLMNKHYSDYSGFDFSASLQIRNIKISSKQAEINRCKGYEAVASLADIVPEEQLISARKFIDDRILINSNFEIVTNSEVAILGIKGNLTLQLKGQNLDSLKGEIVKLKVGNQIAVEAPVEDSSVQFAEIPIGVYTLVFSDSISERYIINKHYAHVKDNQNNATILLTAIEISTIVNQSIYLLGFGGTRVGNLSTELNYHQGLFSFTTKNPHYLFLNELYIKIQVFNKNEEVVFEKEVMGTEAVVEDNKFPLDVGFKIKLFHAETRNRVVCSENIINKESNTNTFIMTKWGLQNTDLLKNAEQNLITKINNEANAILNSPCDFSKSSKTQLRVAISSLTSPNKLDFFTKYQFIWKTTKEISEERLAYLLDTDQTTIRENVTQADITSAIQIVQQLPDTTEKEKLLNKVEVVQLQFNQAIRAEEAVNKLFKNNNPENNELADEIRQTNIDYTQELIKKVVNKKKQVLLREISLKAQNLLYKKISIAEFVINKDQYIYGSVSDEIDLIEVTINNHQYTVIPDVSKQFSCSLKEKQINKITDNVVITGYQQVVTKKLVLQDPTPTATPVVKEIVLGTTLSPEDLVHEVKSPLGLAVKVSWEKEPEYVGIFNRSEGQNTQEISIKLTDQEKRSAIIKVKLTILKGNSLQILGQDYEEKLAITLNKDHHLLVYGSKTPFHTGPSYKDKLYNTIALYCKNGTLIKKQESFGKELPYVAAKELNNIPLRLGDIIAITQVQGVDDFIPYFSSMPAELLVKKGNTIRYRITETGWEQIDFTPRFNEPQLEQNMLQN